MPLRVLYLVRSHAMGGLQRLVRLYLTHLPRSQFEIVFVPYGTGSPNDEAFIDSVVKLGIEVPADRIPWRGPIDWLPARRKIAQLVEQRQFDLIHSHDDQSNMLVGIGRSTYKCACIGSAYGWFEANWYLKLQYTIERRLALPNFDRVYTVSNNLRDKMLATGTPANKIRVIHTGIEPAEAITVESRAEARRRLGISTDALVAGTVSRLATEKGHKFLLEAAAVVASRHPNFRLLCVGQGDQLQALIAQAKMLGIADRVLFPGFVSNLADAWHAMDLFVLPSILDEGFPTVCLEAQMAGLPVLASDIGGTAETVDVGQSALLVRPADARALAEALDGLLGDTQRRLAMGSRARQWILHSFSLETMMRQMAELYQEVASI